MHGYCVCAGTFSVCVRARVWYYVFCVWQYLLMSPKSPSTSMNLYNYAYASNEALGQGVH